jgi:hypothetical protein
MFKWIEDMDYMNVLPVALTMCLFFGLLNMLTATIIFIYIFSVPGQMMRHVDFTVVSYHEC